MENKYMHTKELYKTKPFHSLYIILDFLSSNVKIVFETCRTWRIKNKITNMYYNIRVWHTVPLYPRLQVHVYGAVQNPPFKHKGLHTAKIDSLITIL